MTACLAVAPTDPDVIRIADLEHACLGIKRETASSQQRPL